MSNMGYCKFENTVRDMQDCVADLEEHDWDLEAMAENASSEHEAMAMRAFVDMCNDVVSHFDDGTR